MLFYQKYAQHSSIVGESHRQVTYSPTYRIKMQQHSPHPEYNIKLALFDYNLFCPRFYLLRERNVRNFEEVQGAIPEFIPTQMKILPS